MKILSIDLNKDYSGALSEAVKILRTGGIVVYPTDTVYCLGANACDEHAAELIFKIKNRPLARPLPIIARNIKWARELAFIPSKLERALENIWPGATSVILPKKNIIPRIVTAGENTVSIRIPDYVLTDKLLGKFGYPLTAVSANITGEETTGDINKIVESFGSNIWKPDLILDAGILPPSSPSAILDLSTIRPKILRVGPSKPEQLMKLLGI
ncbi:MAG: threonylcarbamoyl-AMP synthase [Candidatus Yanofskybacteria bacterium]|nr:threonylcarbamoyl-AMP synthase [Candidatus Yanofskybacteria bacterium]